MTEETTVASDIDPTKVSVGQPAEGGCVWTSFADEPTMPTGAAQALAEGFESLGELSTNGFTETHEVQSTDHQGWHGTTLISTIDSEKHKYKLEFVEFNRASVNRLRYGSSNVEVDADGNVTHVQGKALPSGSRPLVIDELMSSGWLRRTVCRKAVITNVDDVAHQKGQLLVYGMEFTANETGGKYFDVYYAKPATPAASSDGGDDGEGDGNGE